MNTNFVSDSLLFNRVPDQSPRLRPRHNRFAGRRPPATTNGLDALECRLLCSVTTPQTITVQADPTGQTSAVNAILQALSNAHNGDRLQFTTGTYLIDRDLTLGPSVTLQASGPVTLRITGNLDGQLAGLTGLNIVTDHRLTSSATGSFSMQRCTISSTTDQDVLYLGVHGNLNGVNLGSNTLQGTVEITGASNVNVHDNQLFGVHDYVAALALAGCHNVVIQRNTAQNLNSNSPDTSGQRFVYIPLNSWGSTTEVSILSNTITNFGTPTSDGEMVLWEQVKPIQQVTITATQRRTVTVADATGIQPWDRLWVVAGTGLGTTRRVTSVAGNVLTLDGSVTPGPTSVVLVGGSVDNLSHVGNVYSASPGHGYIGTSIQAWGGGYNIVSRNNAVSGFNYGSAMVSVANAPVWNVTVSNNQYSNGLIPYWVGAIPHAGWRLLANVTYAQNTFTNIQQPPRLGLAMYPWGVGDGTNSQWNIVLQ